MGSQAVEFSSLHACFYVVFPPRVRPENSVSLEMVS